jgi:hypothetical protein
MGGVSGRARAWLEMAALVATAVLVPLSSASGQISPGELTERHAHLEGISRCGRCHAGDASSDDKCLECHRAVRARIEEKRGLHGRMPATGRDGRACGACHAEHNGRAYELIYWGEPGMNRFDHRRTGFRLEGKHARAECRSCHRADRVVEDLKVLEPEIDLERTFLGLGTGCADCHEDVHREQFTQGCTTCHGQDGWRPAARFEHDRTRYPLRGRHRPVVCARCHPGAAAEEKRGGTEAGDEAVFVRYTGVAHGDCVDCHRDPHRTRLGPRCDGCHVEEGWGVATGRGFDHRKTRFELRGRHRTIECTACHRKEPRVVPLRHERCADCHRDIHLDGFRSERFRGRCELCHTEDAFVPATYGPEEHDRGPYPLEGAHRAIPCTACHPRSPGAERIPFLVRGTDCASCHDDRHRGQFPPERGYSGCRSCHDVDGWRRPAFDHQKTAFPLDGRHVGVPCGRCHPEERDGRGETFVRYRPLRRGCRDCHGRTIPPDPPGAAG